MNHNLKLEGISSLKTICIVKPDAMGDFLLSIPAIDLLRQMFPESKIYLLVSTATYQIAKGLRSVDVVLPIPLFSNQQRNIEDLISVSKFLHTQESKFDLCILMRWDCDYYWASPLIHTINSIVKLGYSAKCSERKFKDTPDYDLFFNDLNYDSSIEHEVVKNMKLIGAQIFPKSIYSEYLKISFDAHIHPDNKIAMLFNNGYYAVAISSSQNFKKLSTKKWISILQIISKEFKLPLVILGGPEDISIAENISKNTKCINLCGLLKPLELIYFLKNCQGLLAVDSFVKHAASFHSVPIIEFSPQSKLGNPESEYGGIRFGAFGSKSILIKPNQPLDSCPNDQCNSQESHCINNLDEEEIHQAVNNLFLNNNSTEITNV